MMQRTLRISRILGCFKLVFRHPLPIALLFGVFALMFRYAHADDSARLAGRWVSLAMEVNGKRHKLPSHIYVVMDFRANGQFFFLHYQHNKNKKPKNDRWRQKPKSTLKGTWMLKSGMLVTTTFGKTENKTETFSIAFEGEQARIVNKTSTLFIKRIPN